MSNPRAPVRFVARYAITAPGEIRSGRDEAVASPRCGSPWAIAGCSWMSRARVWFRGPDHPGDGGPPGGGCAKLQAMDVAEEIAGGGRARLRAAPSPRELAPMDLDPAPIEGLVVRGESWGDATVDDLLHRHDALGIVVLHRGRVSVRALRRPRGR